jgi:hypothetical protein
MAAARARITSKFSSTLFVGGSSEKKREAVCLGLSRGVEHVNSAGSVNIDFKLLLVNIFARWVESCYCVQVSLVQG